MIRTVFVWSSIIITAGILSLLAFITYPLDPSGKVIRFYARLWGRTAILANGVKVEIEGMEHLETGTPYVFMSNHQGGYDILALLAVLPGQLIWLVKKELFSIPFFGRAMALAGYISLDREGTRQTAEAMNKAARNIRDGMSVVIFPEGSRSPDGFIQPFRKGGFTLAIKAGVPIVPLAISGTRDIMAKESWAVHPGRIQILIDPPIETKNHSMGDRETLMNEVRETIIRNFGLMTHRNR